MNANSDPQPPHEFVLGEFERLIVNAERPVLVAFLAMWSQPCQLAIPILREIHTGCSGSVELLTVDADLNAELGVCFGVESIPTLLCFVNGRERVRIVGLTSKELILSKLEPVLGNRPDSSVLRDSVTPSKPSQDKADN